MRVAYAKRSAKYRWMETHIWHAKRMHMQTLWGHRIAVRPCDKGVRASHRATRKACTICDVSYLSTIEVEGDHTSLLTVLQQHLQPVPDMSVFAGEVEICFMFSHTKATAVKTEHTTIPSDAPTSVQEDKAMNDSAHMSTEEERKETEDATAATENIHEAAVCPVTVLFEQQTGERHHEAADKKVSLSSPPTTRIWIQVHPMMFRTVLFTVIYIDPTVLFTGYTLTRLIL